MTATTSSRVPEESDDEDSWEPLESTEESLQIVQQVQHHPRDAHNVSNNEEQSWSRPRRPDRTSTSTSTSTPPSTNPRPRQQQQQNESVRSIQRRLETKMSLQSNLINQPIELLWKRFFINLAREVWALEWRIRLAIAMVLTGIIIRVALWSTWYLWYPRLAVLSLVLIASIVYLDPFHLADHAKFLQKVVAGSPDEMVKALERWDLRQIRTLSFGLFLIPTLLEMRTLSFLSQIKAENGWLVYNVCVGVALFGFMFYQFKIKHRNPREATYMGLLMLYGSALLITLYTFDIRRIPHLAAPFLAATGTLLLTYNDQDMEWLSRLIRHTLRLTLRDVLSSVGERVQEDEMLQLAMLRWISDYWSYQPDESPPSRPQQTPTPSTSTENTGTNHPPAESTTTDDINQSVTSSQIVRRTSSESRRQSTRNEANYRTHDVQWEELLPMLEISTDHMQNEYETLQPNHDATDSSGSSNFNSTFGSNPDRRHDIDEFDSLKSMLASLNVDERAKPAVEAYKAAVISFPPRHRTAVAISILRRCPAMLTIVANILIFQSLQSVFTSIIILSPFVYMEYLRIVRWIETCQRISQISDVTNVTGCRNENSSMKPAEKKDWGIPEVLHDVDAMVILLSGDSHSVHRPPSLLLVWHNVMSSVAALEVGLTAARCIETTAVAAEFAGNVMSLVKFGLEVSERGWVHGLGVIINEAINMRESDRQRSNVTRAVVGAFHSGRRMGHSFNTLREDENLGVVLQPFLRSVGLGWLLGVDQAQSNDAASASNDSDENISNQLRAEQPDGPPQREQNDTPSDQEMRDKQASDAFEAMNEIQARSNDPPPLTFQEELSDVMDMVATAYEQGLLEDSEKSDFLETLSRCSENDRSVLKGMKRSLQVVLENGSMAPIATEPSIDDLSLEVVSDNEDRRPDQDVGFGPVEAEAEAEIKIETEIETEAPTPTHSDTVSSQPRVQEEVQEEVLPQSEHNVNDNANDTVNDDNHSGNDAWIKMGVAAMGVVAGGVFLSLQGRGNDNHQNRNQSGNRSASDEEDDEGVDQLSTLHIEEIPDDDEWTAVSQ